MDIEISALGNLQNTNFQNPVNLEIENVAEILGKKEIIIIR